MARLIGAGVTLTVALGVLLRWQLAGLSWAIDSFAYLRHAHTHLGYYAVLFPLLWLAWQRSGVPLPSRRVIGAYVVAVVLSIAGFLHSGYGLFGIVGSSLVGLFWLASAWSQRRALREASWLASAPPMILAASLLVPPIAVMTARGSPMMHELVRSFLYVQLLGMFVPAALARAELPAPPRHSWWLTVLVAAIHVGPWPHPLLGLAHLGLAGWLIRVALVPGLPVLIRGLWLMLALSLLGVAVGLLPIDHLGAVAGVHFTVIGPILLTFAWRELERVSILLTVVTVAALLGMSGAILLPAIMDAPVWLPRFTALSGSLLALCLVLGAVAVGLDQRTRPISSSNGSGSSK